MIIRHVQGESDVKPSIVWSSLIILLLIVATLTGGCLKEQPRAPSLTPQPSLPAEPAPGTISIGVEYAFPGMAASFSGPGITGVKCYPGLIAWSKMQPSPDTPIDFSSTDRFVKEYQKAGFTDLVIALNTRDSWAIRDKKSDYSPKPEYLDDYGRWVQSLVERYDMDGMDDMPGLKAPVKYYEVGEEFSTYEPESADNYIMMLENAYHSAHNASDRVIVLNSAFLATTAFKDHPGSGDYEKAFAAVDKRIMYHSLTDIRKILDRPDIFDAADFHALGDPYEIEDTVAWLRYEMGRRGYSKPIVIGDTATTPFIAWGPATIAQGPVKGIVVPPAVEGDRARLATYFQKLVDGDTKTIEWTQAFAAQDVVQKVVMAADQNISLIDTAFMEDLTLLKTKPLMAGAGTSPWSGMVDTNVNIFTEERTIKGFRPSFYALGQLNGHIAGYSSVERVPAGDENIRLYRFAKGSGTVWIAWLNPGKLILSGDEVPEKTITVETGGKEVVVERMISRAGQTAPDVSLTKTDGAVALVNITPEPAYIYVKA